MVYLLPDSSFTRSRGSYLPLLLGLGSTASSLPVDLPSWSVPSVVRRGLHEMSEIGDKTPKAGRIAYFTIAFVAFAIIMACFARRSKSLKLSSLRNMNMLRALVIAIYIIGMCFILSAAILQVGIGLDTVQRCRIAIDLCLVFYLGGKVLIYMFLVERAHAIRALKYTRRQDYIWLVSTAVVLLGFGTIAVFAFLRPISEISKTDGKCRIGIPLQISLPLLTYDILINLGMTILFLVLVYPHRRHGAPSFIPRWIRSLGGSVQRRFGKPRPRDLAEQALDHGGTIQRLAWKSFAASIAILVSTVANLSVLFHMKGREQGWLCFTFCTIDISWGVIVTHVITTDPVEMDSMAQNDGTLNRQSALSLSSTGQAS